MSSADAHDKTNEQGSTEEKISKKYVILLSFRCFSFTYKNVMLARLTRSILSPGRFQNVLCMPLKWYAF